MGLDQGAGRPQAGRRGPHEHPAGGTGRNVGGLPVTLPTPPGQCQKCSLIRQGTGQFPGPLVAVAAPAGWQVTSAQHQGLFLGGGLSGCEGRVVSSGSP